MAELDIYDHMAKWAKGGEYSIRPRYNLYHTLSGMVVKTIDAIGVQAWQKTVRTQNGEINTGDLQPDGRVVTAGELGVLRSKQNRQDLPLTAPKSGMRPIVIRQGKELVAAYPAESLDNMPPHDREMNSRIEQWQMKNRQMFRSRTGIDPNDPELLEDHVTDITRQAGGDSETFAWAYRATLETHLGVLAGGVREVSPFKESIDQEVEESVQQFKRDLFLTESQALTSVKNFTEPTAEQARVMQKAREKAAIQARSQVVDREMGEFDHEVEEDIENIKYNSHDSER